MNLEKLGLVLFIKYLQQLDTVKTHLSSSLHELLLAASSLLKLSHQFSEDHLLLRHIKPINHSFEKVHTILHYGIEQLEPTKEAAAPSSHQLKENVVYSIMTVIDEEIETLLDSSHSNKNLKIEALETVKDVLNNQLDQQNQPSDDILEIESMTSHPRA